MTGNPRRFPLPARDLARTEGWGMAVDATGWRYRPRSVEEVPEAFDRARQHGLAVALRGGGRSYGDAAIVEGGVTLDLAGLDRVINWDPESGVIETEPGVTIEKLWRTVVPDGWWPPVVSGTMFTTMAGCASMNIHGKNNFKAGTFGEHVLEFDLLAPGGETLTCSPTGNADVYHAAIGGFGMLGCMTRLKIQMKRVHSGRLWVEAFTTPSVQGMMDEFEDRVPESDYLVGWIDAMAGGRAAGRGIVHQAGYLAEGADPEPREFLASRAQDLPDRMFGLVPKSLMWVPLSLFVNNPGMRFVNMAKFHSSILAPRGHRYLQTHAAFAFLLDYVPDWKRSYLPLWGERRGCGLIQYQSFLPKEDAARTFDRLMRMAREAGLPPYLGVFKKHRPDPFLLTHALDGYSLALDFKVTRGNRAKLWSLCHLMDDVVLDAGGKFYFAKDATLRADAPGRYYDGKALAEFRRLKERLDPECLLQTELARRLFPQWMRPTRPGGSGRRSR